MRERQGKAARCISTRIKHWVNCNRQHSAELFGQWAVMSETLRHEGGVSRASAHFIGISAILAGSCGVSTPALFSNRSWNVALSRHHGTQARVAVPLATAAVQGNGTAHGVRRTAVHRLRVVSYPCDCGGMADG